MVYLLIIRYGFGVCLVCAWFVVSWVGGLMTCGCGLVLRVVGCCLFDVVGCWLVRLICWLIWWWCLVDVFVVVSGLRLLGRFVGCCCGCWFVVGFACVSLYYLLVELCLATVD